MPYHTVGDGRVPDVQANGLNSHHINASLSIIIATKCEAKNVPPLLKRLKQVFVSREWATIVVENLSTIKKAKKRFLVAIISTVQWLHHPDDRGMRIVDGMLDDRGRPPIILPQLKRKVVSPRVHFIANPQRRRSAIHTLVNVAHSAVPKRLRTIHRIRFVEPLIPQHIYPSRWTQPHIATGGRPISSSRSRC